MPQLASPDMPEWAERAYAALGNRPSLAALVMLASQREPVPSWAIAAAAGLKDGATSLALNRLEDAGLVIGSVPPPRPRGTRVTWTVNREALAALVRELDAGLGTQVAADLDSPGAGH